MLKMTYQLSSAGAGRGIDGGPFFSHRPEHRLLKATIVFITYNMINNGAVEC